MAERTITLTDKTIADICKFLAGYKDAHDALGEFLWALERNPRTFVEACHVPGRSFVEDMAAAKAYLVDRYIGTHKKEIPKVIDAPIRVLGRPNRRKTPPENT